MKSGLQTPRSQQWKLFAALLSVACSLTACGGGGGGSSAKSPVPPLNLIAEGAGNVPGVASGLDSLADNGLAVQDALTEAQRVLADRASRERSQQRIGANLNYVRHYTAGKEFNDLVLSAESFGEADQPGTSKAKLGSDGWPLGDFSTALINDQKGTKGLGTTPIGEPGPKYTVVFEGDATVSVINSRAVLGTPSQEVENGKTYTVIPMSFPEGANSMFLVFSHRKGADGKPLALVKNLMVLRPGIEWRSYVKKPVMFTEAFLKHLQPFSTIRFMDWLDTNTEVGKPYSGPEGVWENRPTAITKRTSSGENVPRGQPWERIVELANQRGVDIWINIPPLADEAYAFKLATFLKNGLKYNQRIYVEYGNEMWNSSFKGTRELWASGLAEVIAGTDLGKRLNYDLISEKLDSSGNKRLLSVYQYDYGQRLYVDRLIRMSQEFGKVFPNEMMTRVRPVLTWQLSNPGSTQQILEYTSKNYGPPADYFYALSGAPYFGITAADNKTALALRAQVDALNVARVAAGLSKLDTEQAAYTLAPDVILTSMKQGIKDNVYTQWHELNVMLARKNKLKWIAYEGGPDTFGDASWKNKAIASRDPEMLPICQAHLNQWSLAGGDLFLWFVAGAGTWDTTYGTWPLVENLDVKPGEPGSYKYECMKWAAANDAPVARSRHALPMSFSAGEITTLVGDRSLQLSEVPSARNWGSTGDFRDYVVSAAGSGQSCFNVTMTLKNTSYSKAMPTVPLKILINGEEKLTAPLLSKPVLPQAGSTDVPYGKLCLQQGVSALTLVATQDASFTLETLAFTSAD